jgi:hypothetical protein
MTTPTTMPVRKNDISIWSRSQAAAPLHCPGRGMGVQPETRPL